MTTDISRERRMRNSAERQGMRLNKSNARDPRAVGFAGYNLSDRRTGVVLHGGGYLGDFGLSLDDVEVILCDATDFDVYFNGLHEDFHDTERPALIYRGPDARRIETWRLVDSTGNVAEIGGDRSSLWYVAVEARRYLAWWAADAEAVK